MIKNVMIIATWDLDQNVECSMCQIKVDPNTKPENYLVKGMNEKYNYFVSEHFIIDLEYNMPIQSIVGNTMRGKGIGKKLLD